MKAHRIIVAGSRSFTDYEKGSEELIGLISRYQKADIEIVCGEARGADRIGKRFAQEYGIEVKSFPARWELFGHRAGMLRNHRMAAYATELIVFWDGESHGTKNMIECASEFSLPTTIIRIA